MTIKLPGPMATVDHRRATAEHNREAILEATSQVLAQHKALSMAAVASAAGVSRQTLYAHFKSLGEVVEAAARRAVADSMDAVKEAEPETGPADEALLRLIGASWNRLGSLDLLTRGAAEHLPAGHLHRTHAPLIGILLGLVERGQADGTFRTDMPAPWLANSYFSMVHGADDFARTQKIAREDVLKLLEVSLLDLFTKRESR